MKPKLLLYAGGIAALLAASAVAQSTTELTLDDCVRLARAAQSSVNLARQQREIAGYGIVQARANFLPQASVAGLFAYNSPLRTDRTTFSYVAANGIREYSSLASVGMEFDTSGRLRAQLARARADQDAAAANVALSERDLKRAVAVSFYRLLLARHLVQLARDNLAESQDFEQRSRRLAQNGEAAEADVVKASAQVASFELAVKVAELDAKVANHELASFWTSDVEPTLQLADTLGDPVPPREPQADAKEPFKHRAEFQIFDAQRRGFEADARRARAERLPQLSLVTQYGFDAIRVSAADRGSVVLQMCLSSDDIFSAALCKADL